MPANRDLDGVDDGVMVGATWNHEVTFTTAGGAAIDMSAGTYSGAVTSYAHTTLAAMTVDTSAAVSGEIGLSLTSTQTASLSPGRWRWNLTRTVGSSPEVLLLGDIDVVKP